MTPALRRPPATSRSRKPTRTNGRPRPFPSHTKWTGQLLSRRTLVSKKATGVL
jgi:hypothetical protein